MRGVQNQLYGLPVNPNTRRWQTPLQLGVAGTESTSVRRGGVDRRARILVFWGGIERPETDHKPAGRVI